MTDYEITGSYRFQEADNFFSGSLSISDDRRIEGEIIDPNSPLCSRHDVIGRVGYDGDRTILELVKLPTGEYEDSFALIEYQIVRSGIGDDLSGEYKGGWRAAQPEYCGQIALSHVGEIGEIAIWISETELENSATLTLVRK